MIVSDPNAHFEKIDFGFDAFGPGVDRSEREAKHAGQEALLHPAYLHRAVRKELSFRRESPDVLAALPMPFGSFAQNQKRNPATKDTAEADSPSARAKSAESPNLRSHETPTYGAKLRSIS